MLVPGFRRAKIRGIQIIEAPDTNLYTASVTRGSPLRGTYMGVHHDTMEAVSWPLQSMADPACTSEQE